MLAVLVGIGIEAVTTSEFPARVVVVTVAVAVSESSRRSFEFVSALIFVIDTESSPVRVDRPWKVTNAFWVLQDKSPELILARIDVPDKGIEKFLLESRIRRGIAIPRVTFSIVDDDDDDTRLVVVQPSDPTVEQLWPV